MKRNTEYKLLRRMCHKCGTMYEPTGKYNKLCSKCREEARQEGQRKCKAKRLLK